MRPAAAKSRLVERINFGHSTAHHIATARLRIGDGGAALVRSESFYLAFSHVVRRSLAPPPTVQLYQKYLERVRRSQFRSLDGLFACGREIVDELMTAFHPLRPQTIQISLFRTDLRANVQR